MKFNSFFALVLLGGTSLAVASQNHSPINYIETQKAAKPLGSYSQAVSADLRRGRLIFVSGQIANDAKTGKLMEGDIKTATRQTFNNIEAILKASGTDLSHVIRMDVFLKDFNDWDGMNEEYAKHFANNRYPARQTVQVGMENRIEISCIALAQ